MRHPRVGCTGSSKALDQECRREGFVARETKAVDEYFVNGGDRCLSVLSWSPPKVSPLI
ncbi:hypothetical protein LM247_15895 [Pseudomonas aeruginosa]|uniref:hypothetical protein n=1 Tax=Pseudomonas aeruginosa TaxID=287 RepID=UPI002147EF31|nr:hypothetical protein [Pseudomonas aeruginosa]MCQ9769317.1 hypothetical protein [Pseudomonas aeruginosa]